MPDKKENFCFAPMQKNYMMAAEKLLPKYMKVTARKKDEAREGWYNTAREEDIPIVAKLLEEIENADNIKRVPYINGQYQCKHVKENIIQDDCIWCNLSVAEKSVASLRKQVDELETWFEAYKEKK